MTTNLHPKTGILGSFDRTTDGRMTEVQAVELRELCRKLDEPFDAELTRRQAETRLRELSARLPD